MENNPSLYCILDSALISHLLTSCLHIPCKLLLNSRFRLAICIQIQKHKGRWKRKTMNNSLHEEKKNLKQGNNGDWGLVSSTIIHKPWSLKLTWLSISTSSQKCKSEYRRNQQLICVVSARYIFHSLPSYVIPHYYQADTVFLSYQGPFKFLKVKLFHWISGYNHEFTDNWRDRYLHQQITTHTLFLSVCKHVKIKTCFISPKNIKLI